MKSILTLAVLALGATAACTPTVGPAAAGQTREGRECFFVQEVQSFASTNGRQVYVRTGQNEVFRLETIACNNVDWQTQIGIRARGGGSSICSGFDAELIVPDYGSGPRNCAVTDVHRLTDAELAALGPRDTP